MTEYEVGSRLQRHDLHKLHGLGNDFLVWFQPEVPAEASDCAQRWCNRRTGIGADGLIVAVDDRTRPCFTLFNADGSQAEISGNGLRCFAHAIAARRGLDEVELEITTPAGLKGARVVGGLKNQATATINMGEPGPGPNAGGFDLSELMAFKSAATIDMGNPHIVIEVEDISAINAAVLGPKVEAHFMPEGINVQFVQIAGSDVALKVFERGAGVTAACGSGACAAAVVAYQANPEVTSYTVRMPGGAVAVDVAANVYLTGPSSYIGAIIIPEGG